MLLGISFPSLVDNDEWFEVVVVGGLQQHRLGQGEAEGGDAAAATHSTAAGVQRHQHSLATGLQGSRS